MFGLFVLFELSLLPAVLYYPQFSENAAIFLKLIPIESLREMVDSIAGGGYWGYLVAQYAFKTIDLFGGIAAALIGMGIVAGEVDRRTAEFLVSRPVSRSRILVTKFGVAKMTLLVPLWVATFTIPTMSAWIGETVEWAPLFWMALYASLYIAFVLVLAAWLSTCFNEPLKAGMLTLGFLLVEFSLYLVQGVNQYSLLRVVDIPHYLDASGGPATFPWKEAAAMYGLSLLFFLLALRRFSRRDF